MIIRRRKRIAVSFMVILVTLIIGYGLFLSYKFNRIFNDWNEYARIDALAFQETERLLLQLGYGGFIHNFKNYVLRRDDVYYKETLKDLKGARLSIANLQKLDLGADYTQALSTLQYIVASYQSRLELAKLNSDLDPVALDTLVRVDDNPGLSSLSTLGEAIRIRHAILEQKNRQSYQSILWSSLIGLPILGMIMTLGLLLLKTLKMRDIQIDQLRKSEKEIEDLIENAPDPVMIIDYNGIIIKTNKRSCAMLGYTEEELIGKSVDMLVPDDQRAGHAQKRMGFHMDPRRRPMENISTLSARRKDGSVFPVDIALSQSERKGQFVTFVIMRDISDAQAYLKRLQDEQILASKTVATRTMFLANMSHEIRTPLTGILGLGEYLKSTDLNPDQQDAVKSLNESGEHLLQIINDILDISKIDSEVIHLYDDTISLQKMASSIESLYKNLSEQKNLSFEVLIELKGSDGKILPAETASFVADGKRLRQIALNLTGNALKFTDKGSVIVKLTLHQKSQDGQLSVTVQDSGIGISQDYKEQIFEPFVQDTNQMNRKETGTGLGLAICKRLATSMKGTLHVNSVIGEGSCFELSVPVKKIILADATITTEQGRDASLPLTILPAGNTIKLLIADDTSLNRKVAIKMLEKRGFVKIDEAVDGAEALKMISEGCYDAVLLDMYMPHLSGIEVFDRLKRSYPEKTKNILAFTADAINKSTADYLELGFAACITKPVDWKNLGDVLIALTQAETTIPSRHHSPKTLSEPY